jgi:hypothetical protein
MSRRKEFLKKRAQLVSAVKLDLELRKFQYRKWGGIQRAKRGDWVVENDGDVYTVDSKVFGRTYEIVRHGIYRKHSSVWAEVAEQSGSIKTKEGASRYEQGDYIVYNNKNGKDGYCMSATKFRATYRAR